jgi:hypothetical protein
LIIGNAISNWLFPRKPDVVVVEKDEEKFEDEKDDAPPPADDAAPRAGVVLVPWSSDWYNYCKAKYKTFDAKTGYYIASGGSKKFCQ